VNGTPLLTLLVDAMAAEKLEAILIGNAAAAIHGAPVTTLDSGDIIRRRLALPIEKRMNFLRVRIPGGGAHL
jgi:hypothetical protein